MNFKKMMLDFKNRISVLQHDTLNLHLTWMLSLVSPFSIICMVVDMLDSAIWKVHWVGAHLKIYSGWGIDFFLIVSGWTIGRIWMQDWATLVWVQSKIDFKCLSLFVLDYSWLSLIVLDYSYSHPWSSSILTLFVAKLGSRMCVRHSIFEAGIVKTYHTFL